MDTVNIDREKDKMILSSFLIVLVLYLAFSFTYFGSVSDAIRDDVVRLHILANSDSETDQKVKLQVRDGLLQKNTELLSAGVNKENVLPYFEQNREELENTAKEILRKNGFSYNAEIKLCNEYYTTRRYGELTFPAGVYTSLKVVLGEGKGHNWWCVMFPPLCVPSATGETETRNEELDGFITKTGEQLLSSGEKYKVKFKVVEWYEKLCEQFCS